LIEGKSSPRVLAIPSRTCAKTRSTVARFVILLDRVVEIARDPVDMSDIFDGSILRVQIPNYCCFVVKLH
jgi:hypothetical protein